MTVISKQEFFERLQNGLNGLPKEDIDERLMFYSEMIDDRAEEGLSEEQAVSAVGDVEEIVRQVIADTPLAKIAKERIKPKRRLKAWEITLLAIGSPIWLSLGIAAAAVVLAIYASVWSVVVSLLAVFVSLAASAAGSIPSCVIFIAGGSAAAGAAMLAAGIVCAGLSILMFYGCMGTTKGILLFTKKIAICIKNCFIGTAKLK